MRSQYAALQYEGTHVLGLVTLVTRQKMLDSNTVLGLVVGNLSDSQYSDSLFFYILRILGSTFYQSKVQFKTKSWFNGLALHNSCKVPNYSKIFSILWLQY